MAYRRRTSGRAAGFGRVARIREDVLRQELQTCRAELGQFQVMAELAWQESQELRSHTENWQRERLHFAAELEQSRSELERQKAEIEQKTAELQRQKSEIQRQAEEIRSTCENNRTYQERLSLADSRINSLLGEVTTMRATLTWRLRDFFLRTCWS